MNDALVRRIADAVLYEGYMLYPYRPTSVKNRQRWTFGSLYPPAYAPRNGDAASLHAELLIESETEPAPEVRVRFLHLIARKDDRGDWQEAMEREVEAAQGETYFSFPSRQSTEGGVTRIQQQVEGAVRLHLEPAQPGLFRLSIDIANVAEFRGSGQTTRDEASLHALVATHAVTRMTAGQFVSLTDPPAELRQIAAQCSNVGVWPVLAGDEGSHDCMLVSPIILSDYPQVAPESPGDLFDGAEIDEILTLRIMTMTDAEKDEMRNVDERTRRVLERAESLTPDELMKLHGVLRSPHGHRGAGFHPAADLLLAGRLEKPPQDKILPHITTRALR